MLKVVQIEYIILSKINPIKIIRSDGVERAIFEKVSSRDTISILTKLGGARTVLLSPK